MRNALRYLWMKLWPLILFMFSCCTDLNSPFAVQSVMIAFQTPDFQIYIRTLQGDKTVENLINGMVPEFSPTEPKLAYYIWGTSGTNLMVMNIIDQSRQFISVVTKGVPVFQDVNFSQDGSRIAYSSTVDGNPNICVYDFKSKKETKLTKDGINIGCRISYDGGKVAFWRANQNHYAFTVINANGSNMRILDLGKIPAAPPFWLPDGRIFCGLLSSALTDSMTFDLIIVNPDGSDQATVLHNTKLSLVGIYDNNRILVAENKTDSTLIYLLDIQSGERTRFKNLALVHSIRFSADSKWIGYTIKNAANQLTLYALSAQTDEKITVAENATDIFAVSSLLPLDLYKTQGGIN